MKRPLIAVTPSYNSQGMIRMRPAYLDALWDAGVLPVFVGQATKAVSFAEGGKKVYEA